MTTDDVTGNLEASNLEPCWMTLKSRLTARDLTSDLVLRLWTLVLDGICYWWLCSAGPVVAHHTL